MAKSTKKAKVAKKAAKKVKKVTKAKKAAKGKSKATKKPAKPKAKKVAPKKPAKKKVVAKKAKKVAPKKAVKEKVVKEAKPMRRAATPTIPSVGRKKDNPISPLPKTPPQLNIFPALTQRPIAHKPAKPSAPSNKTRYNDAELKEFETLINEKLDKARREFKILKETLNRNNDEGTDRKSVV